MNVGSLFTGIGGIDLGLERAGMRVVWQCESDPYCRAVLRKHWPLVPCYDDVRTIHHGDADPVDVLAGGFPCQPVSTAGRRLGQDDERWLWPEFARLTLLLRPRFVLVENVPGLLTRGMGDVLGDLAAVGYDAEWDCIPANAIGAAHERDRLWIVAYPGRSGRRQDTGGAPRHEAEDAGGTTEDHYESHGYGQGDRAGTLAYTDRQGQLQQGWSVGSQRRRAGNGRSEARGVQDADGSSLEPRRIWGRTPQADSSGWWAIEPDVGRVAHGVPRRLDRLAALGNAVVPQVAEWIGRCMMEAAA